MLKYELSSKPVVWGFEKQVLKGRWKTQPLSFNRGGISIHTFDLIEGGTNWNQQLQLWILTCLISESELLVKTN